MPASLLDSRLRSVNVNPQLCDRSSPSHGVQLQSLGEFAVTGSWAGRLHHHPQNKRPVLVQIVVLQRLAACGSSAPVTLWWEPHLWLVMGEMKMDYNVCLSVCLSLPLNTCWTHRPAPATLKSSKETSEVFVSSGLGHSSDPGPCSRTDRGRRPAVTCFTWLGHE